MKILGFNFTKPKSLENTQVSFDSVISERELERSKANAFEKAVDRVYFGALSKDVIRAMQVKAYGIEVVEQTEAALEQRH